MAQRGLGLARLPGLLAALVALALLAEQGPRVSAARGLALWPMPLSVQMSPRLLRLSPDNFYFGHDPSSKAGPSCSLLTEAFRR